MKPWAIRTSRIGWSGCWRLNRIMSATFKAGVSFSWKKRQWISIFLDAVASGSFRSNK